MPKVQTDMPAFERLNGEKRENIEAYNDAQHYTVVALGRTTSSNDFANSAQPIKYLFPSMSMSSSPFQTLVILIQIITISVLLYVWAIRDR